MNDNSAPILPRHNMASLLPLLRCPRTGQSLRQSGNRLATPDGTHSYGVSASGVVEFEPAPERRDAQIQQQHYDKVAQDYLENLGYPHTQEYSRYLDDALLGAMAAAPLGRVAEICCGGGEAFKLLRRPVDLGVGVDISGVMLENARRTFAADNYFFLQGDATNLPLKDAQFDSVIMNGGIHHVNDRQALFEEAFRVLKPGGNFYFREPCSDFLPWLLLRAVIYRLSPGLDHETERPLRYRETVPYLERAGFRLRQWKTYGFLGFCFFMNSDILVFNRLFRFVPGIRTLTRAAAAVDDWTVRLPGLKHAGLQVVGAAQRP